MPLFVFIKLFFKNSPLLRWLINFFTEKKEMSESSKQRINSLEVHMYPNYHVLLKKHRKLYGGKNYNDYVKLSWDHLCFKISEQEYALEKEIEEFNKIIAEALKSKNAEHADLWKYSDSELFEMAVRHNISLNSYLNIVHSYSRIKTNTKLLKNLNKLAKKILSFIEKSLRNLKIFHRRNHSFHFKNLDDYHSIVLVNTLSIN